MDDEVSVTRQIGAPADAVWAMVADVTRMGEWSPENEGAEWLRGADRGHTGARFRGVNRHGKKRWTTVGRVTDSDPGRTFRFRVTSSRFPVADWGYQFEVTPSGCLVTESWRDRRGRLVRVLGKLVTGVEHDAAYSRAGMEETLARLQSVAESATGPHPPSNPADRLS